MSGKNPAVNPLQLRKELLIAESDLNRSQMVVGLERLKAGARSISLQAQSIGSLASSATALVAVLSAFQHGKPLDLNTRPNWMQRILKGASLVSTLWLAFRPSDKNKTLKTTK